MRKNTQGVLLVMCLLVLTVTGCSGSKAKGVGNYVLPEVKLPVNEGTDRVEEALAQVDLSRVSEGYLWACCTAAAPSKIQISKEGMSYNYDLANTGDWVAYPLQMGDGTYSVKVLEKLEGDQYGVILSHAVPVALTDVYTPFLMPSYMVDYDAGSACVSYARETLAAGAETDLEVVIAVYSYIKDNIQYDEEKAENVSTGYIPSVDDTFNSQKGICFDYAALTAAMLRACGIPTKVETGYVSPNGIYHAWNEIYVEEKGWIEVGYEATGETWIRMDTTFAAGTSSLSNFVGDGKEYQLKYTY